MSPTDPLVIDAHQHFWRLDRGDYDWLSPDDEVLYRDYLPAELEPILAAHQIDSSIVVQAAPSLAETQYLLSLTEKSSAIAGVVGWIDMASANATEDLQQLSEHNSFLGIRPMLQDIEDARWMLRESLHPCFEKLQRLQLTFDALVLPKHLPHLLELLQRYPDMQTVIDHAAKPDIASGDLQRWGEDMQAIATQTQAHCKLSGLITEAGPGWREDDIYRVMDRLYNWFGPHRLLWGSDWPVLNLAGNYDRWWACTQTWLQQFPLQERQQIMGKNAERFYLQATGQ